MSQKSIWTRVSVDMTSASCQFRELLSGNRTRTYDMILITCVIVVCLSFLVIEAEKLEVHGTTWL